MKTFFEPSLIFKSRLANCCHHDDSSRETKIRQHGGGKDATYHPEDIDLIAYNSGWLTAEKASYIEKHLESCHTCENTLEEFAEMMEDFIIVKATNGKLNRDEFSALLKKISKETP